MVKMSVSLCLCKQKNMLHGWKVTDVTLKILGWTFIILSPQSKYWGGTRPPCPIGIDASGRHREIVTSIRCRPIYLKNIRYIPAKFHPHQCHLPPEMMLTKSQEEVSAKILWCYQPQRSPHAFQRGSQGGITCLLHDIAVGTAVSIYFFNYLRINSTYRPNYDHGTLTFQPFKDMVLYLVPFRRHCSFYVLLTPPLFHPNFGAVPVAPDRPCWGQPTSLKLFGHEIIFEVFQPTVCDNDT